MPKSSTLAAVSAIASVIALTTAVPHSAVGNVSGPGYVSARHHTNPAKVALQRSVRELSSYNPATGSQGFTVFVDGNAALNSSASAGPIALGGNLSFGPGTFNVATQTQGTFTASGDSKPTGLLVGGSINWAGSSSNGVVDVQSSYVKVGNLTGSTVAQFPFSATHVVPTGGSYFLPPQVASTVTEPTASVGQSGLINFSSAFSTFAAQSANLATCTSSVVLDNSNGTPLPLPLSPGTNAYITLTPGTQNVLNISAANLANISILQFQNVPTATMPLIINVDTSGVGNTFSWTPPNINGFQNTAAPYLMWNFPTATQLTIGGSQTVPGTIYAPGAAVNEYDSNGLNGAVIAASYAQGGSGGSPTGGQVLPNPFAATLQSCGTAQLTISLTAGTAAVAPGGTVHYTVTATNTGSLAYTGATFTESLSDVLDDASYNNDVSASSGTAAFTSPNLTWTGNLAIGAAATITFSVTVNNPDTGNKTLASTVTSTSTGSNCASGSTDSRCSVSIPVSILTIAATASSGTTTPGSTVTYTVTVTNSGQAAYTGATFTDPLTGVLDDAAYNHDATATAGTVTYASPNLTWTGNLAVGAAATITFSVTVTNPDTGDKILASTVTSTTSGSNCASDSTDSRCTTSVTVQVPGLTIAVSAGSGTTTTPGSVVHYTVTVTNSGQTPYTGATFTDPLTGVLDDATYNNDASATAGGVTYASPDLTWTGNLAVGAAATITFSVTVNTPDTGDKTLASTVTSTTPGSNCASGSTDSRCTTSVTVLVPGLTIAVAAGSGTTTPGATVSYTVTVTNSGQTAYTGATFTDPLTGVLDDATYNNNASATAGTVSYASPNLTWTGNLAIGASVTVTFSVTVNNPDTGNKILASTVTSTTSGSNCASGSTDMRCSATVDVAVLTIVNSSSVSSVSPGGVVRFTATFTNSGQTPYTGITVASNITDVLDDATPNGDQTATSGTLTLTSTGISWTGDIPVGGTVTVTGTVTVKNPDPGNKVLAATLSTAAPGSNCASGSTDPRCSVSVAVLVPGLTIVKTADATAAVPGQKVTYTVTVTDSGNTPYTGATVTDPLTTLLGDAAYDGDAAATAGSVTYSGGVLTWTGNLTAGAAATFTYSVTVNNPDTGGKVLVDSVSSTNAGSSCPPASPNSGCTVTVAVLTPALTIAKTASPATAVPGQAVSYTVTVTNSGQTPYTGATFTDALTGVLDDAAYSNDASATAGTVTYASPNLTWTGNLAVGAAATITFSVTVNNPDTGDKTLANAITSTTPGSNCPATGGDSRCTTTTPVTTLAIVNTANVSTTTPGSSVNYTVTVTNTGQATYTSASVADPLTGVLDDAAYNNDAAATSGSVAFTSPNLTWTGYLAPGVTATITFSVTVNNPDTGNKSLTSTVTSSAAGSNCAAGSSDARCASAVTVLIPALTITKTATASTTTPGSTVGYTITVADTGPTTYTAATVTDSLGGVLNDGTYNNDATASIGSVSYASPVLTWTGNLAPGDTVTIAYTVHVSNPDTGDKQLVNMATSTAAGSNCPPGGTAPACTATVTDLVPALTITKTATVSTTTPGSAVGYTLTVADTGQTVYTGATVTDSLSGVLGDASYDNDATASIGSVGYASPVLTWTGNLSPGDTATVTYSVTVNNPDAGGRLLSNTAVSAAPGSDCPAGATRAQCSVSIPVISGTLTITVPANANLGSAAPGGNLSASLGNVQVSDNRGFGANWTATVSGTNFTTGTATPAETVPVNDAFYNISGLSQSSGPATFTHTAVTDLNANPQVVVSATSVAGNTAAAWNPLIQLAIPSAAVAGPYTATITHSVS